MKVIRKSDEQKITRKEMVSQGSHVTKHDDRKQVARLKLP